MQGLHCLERSAELEKHKPLGAEDTCIAAALSEDLVEFRQSGVGHAKPSVGVSEVGPGRDPRPRLAPDRVGDGESRGEHVDRGPEMILMVEHHAHLVEQQRVGLAQSKGRLQIFVRQRQVVELEVLHPEE